MDVLANSWFVHEGILSREYVFRCLVETALRDANRPLTLVEVRNRLTSLLKQREAFPEDCIMVGLENNPHIIPSATVVGAYALTEEGITEMKEAEEGFNRAREAFYDHVFTCVELSLGESFAPPSRRALLQDAIDEILGKLFEQHGIEMANALLQGYNYTFPEDYLHNGLGHDIVTAASTLFDEASQIKRLRTAAGVRKALTNIPTVAIPYLISIHRKFFLLKMIGFDPRLQKVQKEALAQRSLFLDTNVILATLFDGHFQHDVTKRTLIKCSNLGMRLFMSKETISEVAGQFERARNNWARLSSNPSLLEVASKCGDDIIVANYVAKYRRLSWSAFSEIFADLESVLRRYGVVKFDENTDRIRDNLAASDDPVATTLRYYKPGKPPETIRHDAFHVYLMDQLRQQDPADEFGHRIWFLTLDVKLTRAQRELVNLPGLAPPYAKLVSDWLPRISIYEGPDASGFSQADYVRLVLQARLGLLPRGPELRTDFLGALAQSRLPLAELAGLPIDVVRRVITRLQTDDEIDRMMVESAGAKDEAAKAEVDEAFKARLEAHMLELAKYDAERTQKLEDYSMGLERHLGETEARAASVEAQLDEIRSQRDREAEEKAQLTGELEGTQRELKESQEANQDLAGQSCADQEQLEQLKAEVKKTKRRFYVGVSVAAVLAVVVLYLVLR